VNFAEDAGGKILRDVTVGLKGPVGTRDTPGVVLTPPDLLQLLSRPGPADDAEYAFMPAIEQLLHGARERPALADRLHEVRVKIIRSDVGADLDSAALGDVQQVRVGEAGAHDRALDVISQLVDPEAAPLRESAAFIGIGR
jgi:hypothetical protein